MLSTHKAHKIAPTLRRKRKSCCGFIFCLLFESPPQCDNQNVHISKYFKSRLHHSTITIYYSNFDTQMRFERGMHYVL